MVLVHQSGKLSELFKHFGGYKSKDGWQLSNESFNEIERVVSKMSAHNPVRVEWSHCMFQQLKGRQY
jgi:hypothetical protein